MWFLRAGRKASKPSLVFTFLFVFPWELQLAASHLLFQSKETVVGLFSPLGTKPLVGFAGTWAALLETEPELADGNLLACLVLVGPAL